MLALSAAACTDGSSTPTSPEFRYVVRSIYRLSGSGCNSSTSTETTSSHLKLAKRLNLLASAANQSPYRQDFEIAKTDGAYEVSTIKFDCPPPSEPRDTTVALQKDEVMLSYIAEAERFLQKGR
jgi:hypothetical protein